MADTKYNSRFQVLLSTRGRLCVLVDDLDMEIVDLLLGGDMTVTELASATGRSRPDVLLSIDRLRCQGLVEEYLRGKATYGLSGYWILGTDVSGAVSGWSAEKALRDLTESEDPDYETDAMEFFCKELERLGISIFPVSYEVGLVVARTVFDNSERSGVGDFVNRVVEFYGVDVGVDVRRMDDEAVEVAIEASGVSRPDFVFVIGSVMSAVNIYAQMVHGHHYSRVFRVARDGDTAVVSADRFRGDGSEEYGVDFGRVSLYPKGAPFAVYACGDEAVMVRDEGMLSILRALESGPLGIAELAAATGLDASRAEGSAAELESIGVIRSDEGMLQICAPRVLYGDPARAELPSSPERVLLAGGTGTLAYSMFRYAALVLEGLGVGTEGIYGLIGEDVASMYLASRPGTTLQGFLEAVPGLMVDPTVTLVLESASPVKYAYRPPKAYLDGIQAADTALRAYVSGLVLAGTEALTGEGSVPELARQVPSCEDGGSGDGLFR